MAANRPNFLFLVVDQMRADHLGCAGNPVIQTPHLDALAAAGVRFDRSYVSNPVCMPSRATLLTGLTPRGHGVRTNGIPLDPSFPTLPGLLQQAGYRTQAVGKLHHTNYQGTPPALPPGQPVPYHLLENRRLWVDGRIAKLPPGYAGFETTDYTGAHGHGIFGEYLNWLRAQDPSYPALLGPEQGVPSPTGAEQAWTMALPEHLHYTTWIADRTIDFLQQQALAPQPFFAWCSFPDPHHPYAAPEPWASMYDPAEVHMPTRRDGELESLPPFYRQVFEGPLQLAGRAQPTRIRDDQLREIIARTYGMVSMVDSHAGRVLAELDRLGLADNTVVVFLSDHGDMLGDHWMLNKGPFHFDGLLRVPMIWRAPGQVKPGRTSSALFSHLDVVPTVLELAGVAPPDDAIPGDPDSPALLPALPGVSQAPHLLDANWPGQASVLVENDEDYLGIRVRTLVTDRYQLTVYPGQPCGDLFDLVEDPLQLHNRWDDPAFRHLKLDLGWQLMERIILTERTQPRRSAHA